MNADRDIFANVVAMRARLGQLQLVNSLVLSKCCRVLRKRRSIASFPRSRGKYFRNLFRIRLRMAVIERLTSFGVLDIPVC